MNVPKHVEQKNEKRKFDKKKFWNLKYNKKLRVQQWEEKRREYVMRKYKKELKKSKFPLNSFQNENSQASTNMNVQSESSFSISTERLSKVKAAQLELERRKEEKIKKREETQRKKKAIQEAIEKYKKKKAEKFKKLSKKTKRGQPVMKERMQLLLEEIQHKIANES